MTPGTVEERWCPAIQATWRSVLELVFFSVALYMVSVMKLTVIFDCMHIIMMRLHTDGKLFQILAINIGWIIMTVFHQSP
jgi:hypothetical protein